MNNLALSETTPVGSVVYRLEGYDPEGGNVSFGLLGSDNFLVDPTSGDVKVIKSLDREVSVCGEMRRMGVAFRFREGRKFAATHGLVSFASPEVFVRIDGRWRFGRVVF